MNQHCPHIPILLVGTKLDLRQDKEVALRSMEKSVALVSTADGLRMQAEIGAIKYLECSALTHIGLSAVFDEAIHAALAHSRTQK